MDYPRYVLVTAAKNEEEYIEETIKSVIRQSVLPVKWVIVSDGSIDGTDEIVGRYLKVYSFIELVRLEDTKSRDFCSKAKAIKIGVQTLSDFHYDYIGNLDADVTFESSYFETIFEYFAKNSDFGLLGGRIYNKNNNVFKKEMANESSVAGAVQMFRKICFEEIGGYQPISTGGIDTVAEVMVRMNGWKTKTIDQLCVYHHRLTGTHGTNILYARYKHGRRDYFLGYHPLFFFLREIHRLVDPPYILGSFSKIIGFLSGYLSFTTHQVPIDVVRNLRKEQWSRIKLMNIRGD